MVAELKYKSSNPSTVGGDENKMTGNKLLSQLSNYLTVSGMTQPEMQIYVQAKPGPRLAELIFLVILSSISKLAYSANAGRTLVYRKQHVFFGHIMTTS